MASLAFSCLSSGVESRLAALTLDIDDLERLSGIASRVDLPSTFQAGDIAQMAAAMAPLFNMLNVRRAIIPAANLHCSARALARYYAALADGGSVPPPHSALSAPPLGSHPHIPKFPSHEKSKSKDKKAKDSSKNKDHNKHTSPESVTMLIQDESTSSSPDVNLSSNNNCSNIFCNPKIHDVFLGTGEYEHLALPNGIFGLGFRRQKTKDGSFIGFGHAGMGGSNGFCDMKNRFSIAVTLNKMSLGTTTGRIIHFVCSELNLPIPEEFSSFGDKESQSFDMSKPLIN